MHPKSEEHQATKAEHYTIKHEVAPGTSKIHEVARYMYISHELYMTTNTCVDVFSTMNPTYLEHDKADIEP